jgi:hypothetical protein
VQLAIKFASVRSYLSKFVLVSVIAVSSLGFFESEREADALENSISSVNSGVRIDDNVENKFSGKSSKSTNPDSNSGDNFSFEFPNIFHVFRSLF